MHGAFLGSVWTPERIFIPSPSGRQRFNVLGAINPIGKQIITVEEDKYINAESVCRILEKIENQVKDKNIFIFLDNAAYQICNKVKVKAKELHIVLKYLPTYSPNLNLIERLWKFIKNEYLYSIYYEKYKIFKNTLSEGIKNCYKNHNEKLKTLMSLSFQSFRNMKITTV